PSAESTDPCDPLAIVAGVLHSMPTGTEDAQAARRSLVTHVLSPSASPDIAHAMGERDTAFIETVAGLLEAKHVGDADGVAASILDAVKAFHLPFTLLGASLVWPKAGERCNPSLHHVAAGETDGVDTIACTLAPGVAIQGAGVHRAHVVLGTPTQRHGRGGQREGTTTVEGKEERQGYKETPVDITMTPSNGQGSDVTGGGSASLPPPPLPSSPAPTSQMARSPERVSTHTAHTVHPPEPSIIFTNEVGTGLRVVVGGGEPQSIGSSLNKGYIPLSGKDGLQTVRQLSAAVTAPTQYDADLVMSAILACQDNTSLNNVALLTPYIQHLASAGIPLRYPMTDSVCLALERFSDAASQLHSHHHSQWYEGAEMFVQLLTHLGGLQKTAGGRFSKFLSLERTASLTAILGSLCPKSRVSAVAGLFLRHGCFITPPSTSDAPFGLTFYASTYPRADSDVSNLAGKLLDIVVLTAGEPQSLCLGLQAIGFFLKICAAATPTPTQAVESVLGFFLKNRTFFAPVYKLLNAPSAKQLVSALRGAASKLMRDDVSKQVEAAVAEVSKVCPSSVRVW
ncbi:hypothetical protein KIPB_010370, partial [Kipferlia bialata]